MIHSNFSYDKNNPHLNLADGGKFFYFDFYKEPFSIGTIAHGLARISRFCGQGLSPSYSVAEHSIRVSMLIELWGGNVDQQMWGLLHDAAEFAFGDIPTPIKECLCVIHPSNEEVCSLRDYEFTILQSLATQLNLIWPIPDIVHKADRAFFYTEAKELYDEEREYVVVPVNDIVVGFVNRFNVLQKRRRDEMTNVGGAGGKVQGIGLVKNASFVQQIDQWIERLQQLREDAQKAESGIAAAGVRVRTALSQIAKAVKQLRQQILAIRQGR